jgi:hypothetical protein
MALRPGKSATLLEAKDKRCLEIDLPGHGDDKTPDITFDGYVKTFSNSQSERVMLVGGVYPPKRLLTNDFKGYYFILLVNDSLKCQKINAILP